MPRPRPPAVPTVAAPPPQSRPPTTTTTTDSHWRTSSAPPAPPPCAPSSSAPRQRTRHRTWPHARSPPAGVRAVVAGHGLGCGCRDWGWGVGAAAAASGPFPSHTHKSPPPHTQPGLDRWAGQPGPPPTICPSARSILNPAAVLPDCSSTRDSTAWVAAQIQHEPHCRGGGGRGGGEGGGASATAWCGRRWQC